MYVMISIKLTQTVRQSTRLPTRVVRAHTLECATKTFYDFGLPLLMSRPLSKAHPTSLLVLAALTFRPQPMSRSSEHGRRPSRDNSLLVMMMAFGPSFTVEPVTVVALLLDPLAVGPSARLFKARVRLLVTHPAHRLISLLFTLYASRHRLRLTRIGLLFTTRCSPPHRSVGAINRFTALVPSFLNVPGSPLFTAPYTLFGAIEGLELLNGQSRHELTRIRLLVILVTPIPPLALLPPLVDPFPLRYVGHKLIAALVSIT